MPSLKSIRVRIGSIKNTRKITRAMKLVSAAKLRRAQEAIVAARPYVTALSKVVSELSAVAGPESHPLFLARDTTGRKEKIAIVVFTSDRGLAGGLNSNLIKLVERARAEEFSGADVAFRLLGKKANQYYARRNANITSFDPAPVAATALTIARETANLVIADFTAGTYDRVFVVYNEFKSAISQQAVMRQILPVIPEVLTASEKAAALAATAGDGDKGAIDFIYEPDKQKLLERLVPQYVQIGLYRAALESIASEFGARMTAMDNATTNAGDIIGALTLKYNRARQASITKELLEIIGGAEALKG
jgi:F-type H+-transporting ATPase subunit gamma